MYVRVNLYRDSHGWKEEAYGKQAVYKPIQNPRPDPDNTGVGKWSAA